MSSRRDEIEAKRARLAELRRQREQKERHFRSSTPDVSPSVQQRPASPTSSTDTDRRSIDNLVEELVGGKALNGSRKEHRSISVQTDSVDDNGVPTQITYDKCTQTEVEETDEEDGTPPPSNGTEYMDSLEEREATPEDPSAAQGEQNATELLVTVEDAVLSSFFTKSLKIINRAIEEDSNHDILQNYEQRKKQAMEEAQPYVLVDTVKFDQPVRSIDTSPFFHDLVVVSIGTSVRLFNTAFHTFDHQFTTQTQIIQVQFSQFQSNFIFGTGYNGKLHIWNLESSSHLPYLTSRVSSSTHSYPVFSLDQVQENNGVIVTASTDGRILHWDPQILSRPMHMGIQLKVPKSLALRYDELTPWCMAHLKDDHGFLLVGAEDGHVYKVKRFDNKVGKDDAIDRMFVGHDAPVTGIDPSKDFAHLFVTCGMDWKVFLWDVNGEEPLMSIYKSNSVLSVEWRPGHITQIGYVYEDVFEVMDLSTDIVVPVMKLKVGKTLTACKFMKHGDRVLLTTFDGEMIIYELMIQDVKSDLSRFRRLYCAN